MIRRQPGLFDMPTIKICLHHLVLQAARAASVGLALAYAHPAFSDDAPEYRCTHYDRVVTVDDVARATTRVTLSLVLSSEAARRRFSQYMVIYNAELQTLKIEQAQTVHADGETVPANLKEAVFDQPTPATAVAPMFSSQHVRFVAFPALRVGDTIQLSYTLKDRATLQPGKFSEQVALPPTELYDDAQETLDTPADMQVQVDAKGMQPVSDTVQGSRRVQIYRYRTPPSGPVPEQADPVASSDTGPYFIATNFTDYAQLGQNYEQGARPQMAVSELIREVAEQITQNVTDRRKQAELIYDWVSRNVRYLAAYVGSGPVVPHSADQVLRNGYGDCKDHDALLIALLNAKGIRADSALINLGKSYRLSSAPAMVVFNHVITWLPEFGVFADSTSSFSPFGVLTFSTSDKPALDTVTGQILHTPPQNSENSTSSSNYIIKVNANGDAEAHGSIVLTGQATGSPRAEFAQNRTDMLGYELLKSTGLTGTLHVTALNREARDQPLQINLTGTIDGIALMPGPAALAVPVMPAYSTIKAFTNYVLTNAGQPLDGPCAGPAVHEHYSVTLPANARIIAIPPNVDIKNGPVSYTARYRQSGQNVEIDRILRRDFQTNVCSGAMLKQWYSTSREISADLKRQILYR